jgi:hypothetical protein
VGRKNNQYSKIKPKNRFFMKPLPEIFIILFVATSCGPAARLERLLAHHPELKAADTLMLCDTFAVPSAEADTCLPFHSLIRPVTLVKDRLRVNLERTGETLYVQGKCKADTVIHTRYVPVEKIRFVKPDRTDALIARIPWFTAILIAFMFLLAFLISRRNLFKNQVP